MMKDYKATSTPLVIQEGRVTSSDDAVDVFRALVGEDIAVAEHFVVITLTGASQVISAKVIHRGTLNQSLVHPRDIFYLAIGDNCAGILMLHNHPSGTLETSSADRVITARIQDGGKILGIEVLDHIIVTEDGHLSMSDAGQL